MYTRTEWINNTAPAINAVNLNKIEQGIFDAHSDIEDILDGTKTVGRAEVAVSIENPEAIPGFTPIGGIIMFSQPTGYPAEYLVCNGQEVSRATYPVLYALLGDTFGLVTAENFVLPDMVGQFVRGYDSQGTVEELPREFGSKQEDEVGPHAHNYSRYYVLEDDALDGNKSFADKANQYDTVPTSDNTGFETRPKNISLLYLIKAL